MTAIDRMSAEPYYLQLGRIIEDRIRDGEYQPGERLPSESEFCRTFDLSRSTVRETLRNLQEQKRIRMVPRRGAFVASPADSGWMLQVTRGFLETEMDNSRTVETRVLRSGPEALPADAAEALALPAGTVGFVLERVRSLDGQPAVHSINYMPADVGSVLHGTLVLEGKQSLNRTLRDAGHRIYGARREVAAVGASAETARLLQVKSGAPVLLIRSTAWGQDGRSFDFHRSFARSDVVTIAVEAQAVDED